MLTTQHICNFCCFPSSSMLPFYFPSTIIAYPTLYQPSIGATLQRPPWERNKQTNTGRRSNLKKMCKLTTMAPAASNMANNDAKQDPKTFKVAATSEHGLSPTLIAAHADHPHSTLASWAFVTLCTASFYLGPLILLSPLVIYPFHPKMAGMIFCTNLFLAFYPISPWPKFRKVCQLFYTVFKFHHNMTPKLDEKSTEMNHLSIVAVHPHAIIPLHGFIWGAICDQLLPHMYGYGCTTVS